MLHAAVPVAPVATNASWITSASQLLLVGGVLLIIIALPPVRRMGAAATDKVMDALVPRRRPVTVDADAVVEDGPGAKPADYRREVEDFDLSLFD